jgi:Mlc titration factor MtfA (ptsG expression regulator)
LTVHPSMFLLLVGALVLLLILVLLKPRFRDHRRQQLMSQPFPPGWEEILNRNVALYRHLPGPLRKELQGHIQVFLGEKTFEGCGGLRITDEMRVTIAGQACILLLNRKPTYYPTLYTILVYPGAYVAKQTTVVGVMHVEQKSVRAGESWTRGEIVLAWDEVRQTATGLTGGHNVVLHEFAHQLDQEDGKANGAPILGSLSSYAAWARILSREYRNLRRKALSGGTDIMDAYGATDPAEFFAVATETFFEKPQQMKLKHPDLYEELRTYYDLDPVSWFENDDRIS